MQVDPTTVWLKERGGQRAFFPDSCNEKLLLSDDVATFVIQLTVEGMSADGALSMVTAYPTPGPSGMSSRLSLRKPLASPVTFHKKAETVNVKVTMEKKAGRPEFTIQ